MMKKYALIIGIENYFNNSGQKKVKFAKNDALEMANYARSAGFQLIGDGPILDKSATYSQVIESLELMFNYVQADDFVLLYYAGHGYYSEYGGYLIPYNYNSNNEKNESTCISFDSINKRLKNNKPAKFVFFLDTCHSGFAGKQIDIRSGLSPDYRKPAKKVQRKVKGQIKGMVRCRKRGYSTGRVVFTSSSPHEPSMDSDEFQHGLFTYYLLHYLKSNSHHPEVNIEKLIPFVKEKVSSYSIKHHLEQNPVAYTNIQGKFYIPSYKSDIEVEQSANKKNVHKKNGDNVKKTNTCQEPDGKPSRIGKTVILGIMILLAALVALISVYKDLIGPSNNKVPDIDMIHIPAGSFLRGTPRSEIRELSNHHNRRPDWLTNETPQQEIALDSFHISKFEITNRQYGKFLEENPGHEKPTCFDMEGFNNPDQPVVGVSWDDADAFCKWLSKKTKKNYRLPTEAEWEKAARGTDAGTYPWGSMEPNEKIVNFSNLYGKPMPVGYYPGGMNPVYGTMEMAGNVAEWCYDWYDKDYYEFLLDVRNPGGPLSGKKKVVRGGSWKDSAFFIRCTSRISYPPDTKKNFLGFRIVLKPAN